MTKILCHSDNLPRYVYLANLVFFLLHSCSLEVLVVSTCVWENHQQGICTRSWFDHCGTRQLDKQLCISHVVASGGFMLTGLHIIWSMRGGTAGGGMGETDAFVGCGWWGSSGTPLWCVGWATGVAWPPSLRWWRPFRRLPQSSCGPYSFLWVACGYLGTPLGGTRWPQGPSLVWRLEVG